MRVRSKHVFVSALTSKGYFSYWDEALQDLKHIYLLQGSPGCKSLFLRLVGLALADRGYQVEYFHRTEDHVALEGLAVRSLGIGVLDGVRPGLNYSRLASHAKVTEIPVSGCSLNQGKNQDDDEGYKARLEAAKLLQEAGEIWACISSYYRTRLNAEAVKLRAINWAEEILVKPTRLRRYFAGAISSEGPINLIPHLTAGCRGRYLVLGAPGTGSLLLQQVLIEVLSRHYEVEIYHSYLNPEEPVMILLPEAEIAVIDGTNGYHVTPQPGDVIWDLSGYMGPGAQAGGEIQAAGSEAELEALLAAVVQALSRAQDTGGQNVIPPSENEVKSFISHVLREAVVHL